MKNNLKYVIYAGLFLVPFIPFFVSSSLFFPFITTKAFVFRIIVEIVFAAWVLLALTDAEYRPRKSPLLYAVGAFLVVMGAATLFGVDPVRSFWSNFERMEGYITLLHLGAFFLVIGSVFREVEWKRWWNTSLVASGLMVFYCLFQLGGAIAINQGGVRVDGTFGNATYLAVYMLIHIFIALLFMWRGWKNTGLRYTYLALILGQLIILYHTATRGAILGLLGGLLIVALLNIRNKEERRVRKISSGILVGLLVVVGGFFLFRNTSFVTESPVLSRFSNISTEELKSGGRSFVWPMALEGVKEKPLLGWGQDNFIYVFQEHYSPDMYHLEPWFDRAHNIFLDWMVSGGVLGLLAYLSLYAIFVYLLWWKDKSLSHMEKSVLTGLLAAYFFHNFFVFDHLLSYILFFAILAYLHSRNGGALLWEKSISQGRATKIALPVIALVLILTLYLANFRTLGINLSLINALSAMRTPGQMAVAAESFRNAASGPYLGREEALSQLAHNASAILNSDVSQEEKNRLHVFAKETMTGEADKFSQNAKQQIATGSFLSSVGLTDEALRYLERAEKLTPGKQEVKFKIAEVYIFTKEYGKALEVLKQAYEMDPTYSEAQLLYALAAIYAGDRGLENMLKDVIYAGDRRLEEKLRMEGQRTTHIESWAADDRIIEAYLEVGRYEDIVTILKGRIERDPMVAQHYVSLVVAYVEMDNRPLAIETLRKLASLFPQYKDQAEAYIKQIQEGRNI